MNSKFSYVMFSLLRFQDAGLEDEMSRVLAIIALTRQPSEKPAVAAAEDSGSGDDALEEEDDLPDGCLEVSLVPLLQHGLPRL